MATPEHYDAIIIGAGQAGGPLSTAFGQAGRKTVIIEREHVGGTCINEGCTPTKTMVASARVAYLARRAADYGVHTGPISIDMSVVRKRKRDIVDSFRGGSERRIKNSENVDLLMGEARFVGQKTLEVIMELDEVPEHLLVLGGGYIALEFGQMFRRFGSKVTIVQRGSHLLSREDKDVAEGVAQILREDGIDILLQTSAVRVARLGDGRILLTIRTNDGERVLTGSHLLVAAGRVPNSDVLDPAATGVHITKSGTIPVNDKLETNVPGIYVLGDVKGGPAFTHISYDDFRIIRTNLLENGNVSIKDRLLMYTVFIDPQLGRVGLSEREAQEQGRSVKVAKIPMDYVARADELAEARGFMKAIVDADSGQILGAAVLGIEGGEIMAMLQLAMMGKLHYTVLREGVFAHPTLAESLNTLFSNFQE